MLLHKVLQSKKPEFLFKKITSGNPQPNTRQAAATARSLTASGVLIQPSVPACKLSLTRSSWCWAAVYWYGQLPPSLRSETKIGKFKTRLKEWVSKNIENLLEVD